MAVLLTEITGPHQSGKSLVAMGALREAAFSGVKCVVVLANEVMARDSRRRFMRGYTPLGESQVRFIGSHSLGANPAVFATIGARFVLFEDVQIFDPAVLQDNVKAATNWLNTCLGPTQILITRAV